MACASVRTPVLSIIIWQKLRVNPSFNFVYLHLTSFNFYSRQPRKLKAKSLYGFQTRLYNANAPPTNRSLM